MVSLTQTSRELAGGKTPTPGVLRDLTALTALAAGISDIAGMGGLEGVLDWIRAATHTESAELFLAEPGTGDMVLTGYRGPFKSAFSEITRFRPGEGFPGLVMSHEQPVFTDQVVQDARYLRTRVKEKGYRAYVSVPLRGQRGVIGTLNAASRVPRLDAHRVLGVLEWAAMPISIALEAGLLRARVELAEAALAALGRAQDELENVLHAALRGLVASGGASGGELVLYDRVSGGVARRVAEGETDGALCADLDPGRFGGCPALTSGHTIALHGARERWPGACRQVSTKGGTICCLPLVAGEQRVGVVQLRYPRGLLWPPTRHLVPLMTVAGEAARVIAHAWADRQRQEGIEYRLSEHLSRLEYPADAIQVAGRYEAGLAPDPGRGVDPPILEIRCLGGFELYRQGQLITPHVFGRRAALTLLKILIAHRERPVPADVLTELIWPEAAPRAGRTHLHVLVHALREVVEPHASQRSWQVVCRDRDRYFINRDATCRMDVDEFHRLIVAGKRLEHDDDVGAALGAYEAAARLYRGDFLADEPYADWCWEEREVLKGLYLDLRRKLAGLYAARGELARSIESYRLALWCDPVQEATHRDLMLMLWAAGRRDEAIRQYHQCREILIRELDVAPLPETESLYRAILTRETAT